MNMLKKTLTFEDFNGEKVTEDLYFNLTKAELVKMEFTQEGGLRDTLALIIASQDTKQIIEFFQKIILSAYGKKSDDGKKFEKTDAIREEFTQTAAYDALFEDLILNAQGAAEFVNGILPSSLVAAAAERDVTDVQLPADDADFPERKYEDYTDQELLVMPWDQFHALVGSRDPLQMSRNQLVMAMKRKNQPGLEGQVL
jgi:hypothetical protein